MTQNHYDAIIIGAELKPPAQYREATSTGSVRRLRAGTMSRLLASFQELRQDFAKHPVG